MLNTLIPKGSAALGQAQCLFWKPKNQRHKAFVRVRKVLQQNRIPVLGF